jgi:hypothetical protein
LNAGEERYTNKNKLLLIPICIGIALIVYSWFSSYPLVLDSPTDFLFNHISQLYWIGLALTLASLYVLANTTQNAILRWLAITGIVTALYSLSYFYYLVPGSDSHYFRGLTEYSLTAEKLDPSEPYHSYYQWPLFFVLSKVAYVLGLDPRFFQFVLYGVIGIIYATSLYYISSKFSKEGAFLAVISFFINMRYYLNYQFAPFSLSFALLLVLFIFMELEVQKREVLLSILFIFTSMSLMHSFVPVLFILYVLVKYFFSRNKMYVRLFIATLVIYFMVLAFQANIFLPYAIRRLSGFSSPEYVTFAEGLIVGSANPVDALAQLLSRILVIASAAISGLGFFILLLRKRLRQNDYVIFVSGATYAILGAIVPILGTRAFALIGISAGLGATYFLKGRFKIYYQFLFLVLIVMSVFIPLHSSFVGTSSQVQFQTQQDHGCASFLLEHYDWNRTGIVLSDIRTTNYLAPKSSSATIMFESDFSPLFPRNMRDYDVTMLTIGLEKSFLAVNLSRDLFLEIQEKDRLYDSGSSSILIQP